MFDIGIVFIFQNIFILMMVFWLLSWLGDKFYKNKDYKASEAIYECGFSSTHSLRVSVNFGFFIIASLLILYDIEFFFLIPAFFNIHLVNALAFWSLWAFIGFVTVSFAIDWETISLKWLS